jgi:hypothetical protein
MSDGQGARPEDLSELALRQPKRMGYFGLVSCSPTNIFCKASIRIHCELLTPDPRVKRLHSRHDGDESSCEFPRTPGRTVVVRIEKLENPTLWIVALLDSAMILLQPNL